MAISNTKLPTKLQYGIEEIKYHKLYSYDFETIVDEVYPGHKYSFVADIECGNDTDHVYDDITGRLDEYDEKDLEKFKTIGKVGYMARILLNDMVRNKIMPPGDYLIWVSW